jgi:simple sugar transport system permease protein
MRDPAGGSAGSPADRPSGEPVEGDADAPRKGGLALALLRRPELAAVAGTLVVWVTFALLAGQTFVSGPGTAAVLNAAAPLGILAVAVALLMIAGEFDLSVGSVIGAAGMCLMLLAGHLGWGFWPALAVTVLFSVAVGVGNGLLVVRTGLPSFIVTLATLFVLRGLTIGVSRLVTGRTQIGGLREVEGYEAARLLFGSTPVGSIRAAVLWWLGCGLLGVWVLRRTTFGNWIFATGGNPEAARNAGVPVARVKVTLFAVAALAACLVAVTQAVQFGGADALRGQMLEFRAIIAVVIGGTLLTGGYGSVLGAVLGALIFGMVQQGLVITGVDADWFQVFLGVMLLLAVVFNHAVRTRIVGAR